MINRVCLMGRLTGDPELKTMQCGDSVVNFDIAVQRSYVKAGEERKADFFHITVWRSAALIVSKYFRRGSLIAIDGRLQTRSYQAKDGTNRNVVEVVADSVHFTGERNNSDMP
ncbi:MAG: single-stranded DNA-binding protein [Ruminococcus sp.]|nr:single-stranded DNA-binding protein [Ruminococcus sp.]